MESDNIEDILIVMSTIDDNNEEEVFDFVWRLNIKHRTLLKDVNDGFLYSSLYNEITELFAEFEGIFEIADRYILEITQNIDF